MNVERLEQLIDLLKTIPNGRFDMGTFRKGGDTISHICNTAGCAVGWGTQLDTEENVMKYKLPYSIDFVRWSCDFFEIPSGFNVWEWMFSEEWECIDNTPLGAAKRIRYLLDNGVPLDFDEEYLEYFYTYEKEMYNLYKDIEL